MKASGMAGLLAGRLGEALEKSIPRFHGGQARILQRRPAETLWERSFAARSSPGTAGLPQFSDGSQNRQRAAADFGSASLRCGKR